MEVAVLGGGCFWCLEAVFEQLRGVQAVVSGYCGGLVPDPRYADVCHGETGHAEVVRIEFQPTVISFRELLAVFFLIHDPTTRDRQGNDVGSQYRSIIFCQSPSQRQISAEVIEELNESQTWNSPVITELASAQPFYPAEDYHQKYFRNNPGQGYCTVVVGPKVAKFRKAFEAKLKPQYS